MLKSAVPTFPALASGGSNAKNKPARNNSRGTKKTALFDIVNTRVRSLRLRSILQPELGPTELGRFALANSERDADEPRAFWPNEPTLQKRNRCCAGLFRVSLEGCSPTRAPCYFPVIYRGGLHPKGIAHARSVVCSPDERSEIRGSSSAARLFPHFAIARRRRA
jgi:hypothetical protein